MSKTELWFQRVKIERQETLARLHEGLLTGRIGGVAAANDLSDSTDRWLCQLFDHELGAVACSIIAIGGFGRQELSPQSDLDLLILVHQDPNDQARAAQGHALSTLGCWL